MLIDLRSDTVTRPTPAMRQAMAQATVGDDVLGDDPTVIELQEKFAALLGKEAAVFVPSGTMANQVAIRAQTEPGDELIAHEDSHIIHYETGAPAALSGVMIRPLKGPLGQFDADQVDAAVRPYSAHFARSRLLEVENTHNRGSGSVWAMDKIQRVTARAKEHGLRCHLDGARLWNACAKTGLPPAAYARHFDTISCCFSKGLGAPAGSAVAGDKETIFRAHRFRKMFGGAMRQAGVLAAAAQYALDNHRERLAQDHANAKKLAEGLANIPGITINLNEVDTNMVFFDLSPAIPTDAAGLCQQLKPQGVWMLSTALRRIRAVVHLDIHDEMIPKAIDAVAAAVGAKTVAAAAR